MFEGLDWKLIMAVWGAGLSTLLAFLQLREKFNERTRIFTTYAIYGHADIADKIVIKNLGKQTVLIDNMEVFLARRLLFSTRNFIEAFDPTNPPIDILIPGNSTYTIHFSDQNKLPAKKGRHLFIKLCLTGNRSKILKVV